jgi:hypothetical protein
MEGRISRKDIKEVREGRKKGAIYIGRKYGRKEGYEGRK